MRVVGLSQVLHNGDIIADGFVRALKPQAAKGAEGAPETGAGAVPAEATAAHDSAVEQVSPRLKHPSEITSAEPAHIMSWYRSWWTTIPSSQSASCKAHCMMARWHPLKSTMGSVSHAYCAACSCGWSCCRSPRRRMR